MYDVALLIERRLESLDADQIVALHEGLDEQVTYHLLLPVESSAPLLGASLNELGGGGVTATDPQTVETLREATETSGHVDVDASAALLTDRGQQATSQVVEGDPIDALKQLVSTTASSEVIVLTEQHLVAEFFHVDWTSRARRALDVPTLHLLEHVPLDAQR